MSPFTDDETKPSVSAISSYHDSDFIWLLTIFSFQSKQIKSSMRDSLVSSSHVSNSTCLAFHAFTPWRWQPVVLLQPEAGGSQDDMAVVCAASPLGCIRGSLTTFPCSGAPWDSKTLYTCSLKLLHYPLCLLTVSWSLIRELKTLKMQLTLLPSQDCLALREAQLRQWLLGKKKKIIQKQGQDMFSCLV